jgi:hypothetical protein
MKDSLKTELKDKIINYVLLNYNFESIPDDLERDIYDFLLDFIINLPLKTHLRLLFKKFF